MRIAAVTGATGFLGRHLVRSLAEDGWTVRALVRRDPARLAPVGIAPEIVIGGLGDAAALARLCDGAEVLIHAAGLIKARREAEFDLVNVEGSARAAEAAAQAGVARMLLVSSLAAREPQLSPYAASKRAGEEAAAAVIGERLSVLRPPAIYGPGDVETLGVFQAAAKLPAAPVFDPRARIAMIHVEDAARQIAAAAAVPPTRGVVGLSDARPEGYTWREIVNAAAEAVRRRPRLVQLPSTVLTAAGYVGALQRIFGGNPILGPGKAREMRHLDWSLALEERWPEAPQARFGLIDGFAQTAASWRVAGKLPS